MTTANINQNNDCNIKMWEQFILSSYKIIDPIVYSMFRESIFIDFDKQKNILYIKVLKKFMIFNDMFSEYKSQYQLLLDRCFNAKVLLVVDFYQEENNKSLSSNESKIDNNIEKNNKKEENKSLQKIDLDNSRHYVPKKTQNVISRKLDISDKEKWKLTNILLNHFQGTISEIRKDTHEPDA